MGLIDKSLRPKFSKLCFVTKVIKFVFNSVIKLCDWLKQNLSYDLFMWKP